MFIYMVELLLSHSKINVDAKDSSERRPIDVYACVSKIEYQKVTKLLLNWKRLNKIQTSRCLIERLQDILERNISRRQVA
ncbi:tRNA dimethylallyltransferase [Dirofilaria immitis]